MVIKKSSRILRYLSWLDKVYESKLIESKSLCPLFWKTIFMTLFLPIFLPFIGLINLAKIVIDKYISKMVVPNYIKIGLEMILFCSITAYICTVVGVIVYYLITDFLHTCLMIGIGSLFILVCASPIAVRKYFERKAKEDIVPKSKDTSVKDFVIEGISSIKNRVCPLIVFQEDLGVFETVPVYKELVQTLLQVGEKIKRSGFYPFYICLVLDRDTFKRDYPIEGLKLRNAIQKVIRKYQKGVSERLFETSNIEIRVDFLNNVIKVLDSTKFISIENTVEAAYQLTKAQLHQDGEENT